MSRKKNYLSVYKKKISRDIKKRTERFCLSFYQRIVLLKVQQEIYIKQNGASF